MGRDEPYEPYLLCARGFLSLIWCSICILYRGREDELTYLTFSVIPARGYACSRIWGTTTQNTVYTGKPIPGQSSCSNPEIRSWLRVYNVPHSPLELFSPCAHNSLCSVEIIFSLLEPRRLRKKKKSKQSWGLNSIKKEALGAKNVRKKKKKQRTF